MEEAIKKADVLIEALPYIKRFRGRLFVIKYGGSILSEEVIRKSVIEDIVFLYFMGIDVVLVHGGGPNISDKLKKLELKSEFYKGIRVTDKKTLDVVENELLLLNGLLCREIADHKAKVFGLEGKDNIVFARKKHSDKELGFVGEVIKINSSYLQGLIKENHIIILSPMGINQEEKLIYNINADEVASSIAGSLRAEKLVLLTDVKGIMRNTDDDNSLISTIREDEIKLLIKEGVISRGMLPKVLAANNALDKGAKKVHIIDAKIPHALLLEIFTDKGVGTEILQ